MNSSIELQTETWTSMNLPVNGVTEGGANLTMSAEGQAEDTTTMTFTSGGETELPENYDVADYSDVITMIVFMSRRTLAEYIVILFIVVLGLLGNMLVVVMMLKNRILRKQATNVLILNQSIIDLLAALFIGITCSLEVFNIYGMINVQLSDSSFFSHLWCAWFLAHDIIRPFFYTSTVSLLCITLERYIGICHPLTHLKWGKKKITRVFIIITWIIGPMIGLYFIHAPAKVENGVCLWKTVKYIAMVDVIVHLLTHYFLPVGMLVLLYALIVKELHDKLKAYSEDHTQSSSAKTTLLAKTTTVKMLITISVFYVICWTGVLVDYILIKTDTLYSVTLYHMTELALFTNCCCNPFIYIFRSQSYRSKIMGLFFSTTTSSTD